MHPRKYTVLALLVCYVHVPKHNAQEEPAQSRTDDSTSSGSTYAVNTTLSPYQDARPPKDEEGRVCTA